MLVGLFLVPSLGASPLAFPEGFAQDGSDLPPDGRVVYGTLGNGLRYAILPHDEPPGRVSMRLYVGAGSLMESEEQQGLAHYLEHMAFNGTENFPAGEMVEYFQRLGMAFGADTNAHTSFDETVYQLELPNRSEALLRDSFLLLQDYATAMTIAPEEVEKERGVILAELVQRDSVRYRTFVEELAFNLPGSRLRERLPIGLRETIEAATAERLRAYYESWYVPERMFVAVVGDVVPEEIEALVAEYFGGLPAREVPELPEPVASVERALQVGLHRESEAEAVSVSLTSIRPVQPRADTLAHRSAELRRDAAHAILNRRLDELARAEGAPFTRGSAVTYRWLDSVRISSLELTTTPERWEEALAVAEQGLRRALEHGFTEAEVAEVRANFRLAYERAVETAPTRPSRSLATGLVRAFGQRLVFLHPADEARVLLPVIAGFSPELLQAGMEANWAEGPNRWFVAGNVEASVTVADVEAARAASAAVAVLAPAAAAAAAFAYAEFGDPGEVIERVEHEDLGITQLVFANQLRVNLKETDFEAGTIRLLARVGGGVLSLPRGREELALVANETFIAGGLEAHPVAEIRRIFAGTQTGVSFTVGSDAFQLAGVTSTADLEKQLSLMTAYLVAPGYRQEALGLMRRGLDALYRTLTQRAEGVLQNEVANFLAEGDPRFGFPSREALEGASLAALQAWLEPELKTGYLEVSVVGDFETEAVVPLLAATLGALPERAAEKPSYRRERRVDFPDGEEKSFTYPTKIPRSMAAVYWPTDDLWDIGKTRRLRMLGTVLDDRLRLRVREELGDAYSPFAFATASETFTGYGFIGAVVPTAGGREDGMVPVLREIAEDLVEEGITPDELRRAKTPELEKLKQIRRNNAYWLNSVLASSQEHPERLRWARTIEEDFAAITEADLEALAREYLDYSEAATVLIRPVRER